MSSIVIISGPTASGKSALALEFSKKKDIAIINADSLQIYQGLPLLSAQPSESEKKQVPHFLYSHFKPQETSSVATWLDLIKPIITQLWQENKLPVIVGGSGMYISKLVEGISKIPQISEENKAKARKFYENLGREKFIEKLLLLGEDLDKIEKLDKQRLIRAYEVFDQTGKSIYFWQKQPNEKIFPEAKFLHINLNPNREELYKNCNLRFEKMLKLGALEEVKALLNSGITNEQITKTLGFAEICDFLNGEISKEQMLKNAAQKTRNYAKRQLTWFRNQLPDKQVFSDNESALEFLSNCNEI